MKNNILITTTNSIENAEIEKYFGIVFRRAGFSTPAIYYYKDFLLRASGKPIRNLLFY